MPLVAETGDTVKIATEAAFEWRIKDFFKISEKQLPDNFYRSPIFSFADSFWYLVIYPNGQTRDRSEGWIDLYLARENDCSTKTVCITLGIRVSGVKELCFQGKFSNSQKEMGELKYASRAELLKTMASTILTVHCELKCLDANATKTSVLNSQRKVGRNLRSILADRQSGEFTLICQGHKFTVHEAILRSRCKFFDTMFSNSWKGSTTGELKFPEADKATLESVLCFIYSGEVEDLSDHNVCSIYICAHTFGLVDLKGVCVEYIKRNLNSSLVFRTLEIPQDYVEEDLKEHLMKYLYEKSYEVFKTEEWEQFKARKKYFGLRILEKTLAKRREMNKRIKLMDSDDGTSSSACSNRYNGICDRNLQPK